MGKISRFVLEYLREIQAEVTQADGVYTVTFPPGRKRRFGGQRRFVFDPQKAQPHVELLEPGSPLLKLLLLDAKQWGGLGTYASKQLPAGTLVYTFQFTTFSSLKKRTAFFTATLGPDATAPRLHEGVPELFDEPAASDLEGPKALERIQNGLALVMPNVETAGRAFAAEAGHESADAFHKSLGRVNEYFEGLRQESFTEEARIKKRLGEIQSKLYFTEDGLRQIKLERERERLTKELYQLKQRRTQSEDRLSTDQQDHVERQRRRYEPKLVVRLVAATLVAEADPGRPSHQLAGAAAVAVEGPPVAAPAPA